MVGFNLRKRFFEPNRRSMSRNFARRVVGQPFIERRKNAIRKFKKCGPAIFNLDVLKFTGHPPHKRQKLAGRFHPRVVCADDDQMQ